MTRPPHAVSVLASQRAFCGQEWKRPERLVARSELGLEFCDEGRSLMNKTNERARSRGNRGYKDLMFSRKKVCPSGFSDSSLTKYLARAENDCIAIQERHPVPLASGSFLSILPRPYPFTTIQNAEPIRKTHSNLKWPRPELGHTPTGTARTRFSRLPFRQFQGNCLKLN